MRIGAGAPDPSKCRAKSLTGRDVAACLAEKGAACCFASWFGGQPLCTHPARDRIIERTLQEGGRAKAA